MVRNDAFNLVATKALAPLVGCARSKKGHTPAGCLTKSADPLHPLKLAKFTETYGTFDTTTITVESKQSGHATKCLHRFFAHVFIAQHEDVFAFEINPASNVL